MAEKVRDGLDGYHFRAGSAQNLADRLIDVLSAPRSWDKPRATLRRPTSHVDCGREHVALHRKLLKAEQPAHASAAVA